MKPGMGIMDILPVQPHHFLAIFDTANLYFGGNLSSFVAIFTKITTLYSCRLYRYQCKVNISSSERYIHKSWEGNQRHISCPSSPHSTHPTHILKQAVVCSLVASVPGSPTNVIRPPQSGGYPALTRPSVGL